VVSTVLSPNEKKKGKPILFNDLCIT
jgi:hypothetical protein